MWDLHYKLKLLAKRLFTDKVINIEEVKKGSLVKIVYDLKSVRNQYVIPYAVLLVSDVHIERGNTTISHLGKVENGFFKKASGFVYFNDKLLHLEKPTMQDYLFFAEKARINKLRFNKKKILLGKEEKKISQPNWRFIC